MSRMQHNVRPPRTQKKRRPWTLFVAPLLLAAALMINGRPDAMFAVIALIALALLCTVYGVVALLCHHPRAGRAFRMVRLGLLALMSLGVATFLTLEIIIVSNAHSDPDRPADCLLVLGAGLQGERLSYSLMSRLDIAIEYLHKYPGTPVVVSGGQGPGESISEAEAMYRYLVRNGIDDRRIIKENRSRSTEENFSFSRPLMPAGTQTLAVATNEYHMYRARYLARREGLTPVGLAAETPFPSLKLVYFPREAASVLFMFLGW